MSSKEGKTQERERGSTDASSQPNYSLDWQAFDQTMKDLLGNESQRGDKRERKAVESCESPSSSHTSQELVSPRAKKRKTLEKLELPGHGDKKNEISRDLWFRCAACGQEDADYKALEEHVKEVHVGEDLELVLASILVPEQPDALKTFQCGVKSCGLQYIGSKEKDLRDHIISAHGEYYVDVCSGRNIIRICRVCSGRFSSDQELSSHIEMWHASKCFANGELSKRAEERSEPHFSPEVNRNVITRPEEMDHQETIRVSRAHMDFEAEKKERKSEGVKERLTWNNKLIQEERSEEDQQDLKFKLRKFREKYCEACQVSCRDWAQHKTTFTHSVNDQRKAHCLFCPKRLFFAHLKTHLKKEHSSLSFKCNVDPKCSVTLVSIRKIVEHINNKHNEKKQVKSIVENYGEHWDLKYADSKIGERRLFLLPSDLRRFQCGLCGHEFLCQDLAALTNHFTDFHPHLHTSQHQANILFSCRPCKGILFGAEHHLMNHIREVHGDEVHQQESREDKEVPGDNGNYQMMTKKTKKKEKVKKKISIIKAHLLAEFDKKQPDEMFDEMLDVEAVCCFCESKLFKSRMEAHQLRQHQEQMFSCDGSCGRKFFSPNLDGVLDHLRNGHELRDKSDEDLMRGDVLLPGNLQMIQCKEENCRSETTFLAPPDVASLERRMVIHSVNKHPGEGIKERFVLGCRACPRVWRLEEEEAWTLHCQQFHVPRKVEVKEDNKVKVKEDDKVEVKEEDPSVSREDE